MPYSQAGDVKLYYETFGDGVPLLFVSGTGWPGAPWKLQQVPAFSDRYRVIVYDHRGVGKSDAPKGPYSTRQFAQDAIHLLDAIGVKEPTRLIGHSMGGRVCQWIAIDHPQRVLNRDQLLNLTQGRDAELFERSIDLLVSRLRQRLGDDAREPRYIKTVRSEGYVFAVAVEAQD